MSLFLKFDTMVPTQDPTRTLGIVKEFIESLAKAIAVKTPTSRPS